MTMKTRLWLLDNGDFEEARRKLDYVKSTLLADFEWITWDETNYKNPKEAFAELVEHLGTPSMFSPGKVVICYGLPRCQADIAESLPEIADQIMLVVVGKPDARSALYKAAKKMGSAAKVDDALVLKDRKAAVAWAREKAGKLGIEIDDRCLSMLVDFVGTNPSSLSLEMKKLGHLSRDGRVHPWVVEQGCSGTGAAAMTELTDRIGARDFPMAHEFLDRLLAKGEAPLAIAGFLAGWCRRMALADSCSGSNSELGEGLSEIVKYQRPKKAARDSRVPALREKLSRAKGKKAAEKIRAEIEKERDRLKGHAVPMFPKSGALFHAVKRYNAMGGRRFWAYSALRRMGNLQLDLRRKGMRPEVLLHAFLCHLERDLELETKDV